MVFLKENLKKVKYEKKISRGQNLKPDLDPNCLTDGKLILKESWQTAYFFRNFPAYTELMLSEWPNNPFSHSYDIYPRNSDTKMSLNTLIILKFDLLLRTAHEL